MDTPGSVLRTERKKQKKSLKWIARALKIKTEYLKAIEDDDYSLLPAEIYTKAYLRLYANLLGLDSDFMLDLYKNVTGTGDTGEPEPPQEKEIPEYKPALRFSSLSLRLRKIIDPVKKIISLNYKPVLIIIASIIIVVILVVIFTKGREQKTVTETVTEAGKTQVPAKKEKLSLKITAVELTWVSVSIDGGKRREWLLRPGETVTLSAEKRFALKVGNAGGTRVIFNNRDIGKLGPSGKVVDLVLP